MGNLNKTVTVIVIAMSVALSAQTSAYAQSSVVAPEAPSLIEEALETATTFISAADLPLKVLNRTLDPDGSLIGNLSGSQVTELNRVDANRSSISIGTVGISNSTIGSLTYDQSAQVDGLYLNRSNFDANRIDVQSSSVGRLSVTQDLKSWSVYGDRANIELNHLIVR